MTSFAAGSQAHGEQASAEKVSWPLSLTLCPALKCMVKSRIVLSSAYLRMQKAAFGNVDCQTYEVCS